MSAPEHSPDDAAFRAALRREKLAARRALDAATHAAHSARIAAHLETLLRDFAATLPTVAPTIAPTLAFCAPIDNEFDARPLVARLLAEGWRAAMPVVIAPTAPMIFRAWTPTTPMTSDRHGIPIPVEIPADPPTGDNAITPDIVLLPLVAFDAAGYRLGYGGGYFDRTLAALAPRPRAIGVGFELARAPDIRPQAHDLPLDAIVTEAGTLRFQRDR